MCRAECLHAQCPHMQLTPCPFVCICHILPPDWYRRKKKKTSCHDFCPNLYSYAKSLESGDTTDALIYLESNYDYLFKIKLCYHSITYFILLTFINMIANTLFLYPLPPDVVSADLCLSSEIMKVLPAGDRMMIFFTFINEVYKI